MKIIILNGSPRKNGACGAILKFIQSELKQDNTVEIEYINISDLNIGYCNGCSTCFKTGECFMKDDADEVANKLSQADGLVIASPTYESNISGQLKTFFDRAHFIMEQRLYKKKSMIFTIGENYGKRDSLNILEKVLVYSGAQISFKACYNMPFERSYALSEKTSKIISGKTSKFISTIRSSKILLKDRFMNSVVFNFGIKPFVLSKKDSYQGVVNHWKDSRK